MIRARTIDSPDAFTSSTHSQEEKAACSWLFD